MTPARRSLFTGAGWLWLTRFLPSAEAKARARDIYGELGVRPVINFRGTHTTIGASKQWPELAPAMEEAARHFVSLDELQDRVGERLAKLIGTESAVVTTGAAGAIEIGTAACVAGKDLQAIRRLPDTTGLKNEVIMLKLHRNGYDHAARNAGIRIVEVENEAELRAAIGPRTAQMHFLGGTSGDHVWPETLSLEQCLAITKPAGVPLLVDAANMLPPWNNLRKLAAVGADLICVSGGKHLRGPQCSGILAGRRDLIEAARANTSPHSDSIGRPLKTGREEIVGVWLAAEKYSKLDFDAIDKENQRQAEYLKAEWSRIAGVRLSFAPFDRTRRMRRLIVEWDETALGITAAECEKRLWDGSPRIAVLRHQPQGVVFTCFMNESGDEKIAARRLAEVLGRKG